MELLRTPGSGYLRRQSVSLGGVEVQIVTRWAEGPQAWYVSVETGAGEPIISGRRITPAGYVWFEGQDPRLPPGSLIAVGPDPYRREQLGIDVRLGYLAPGERL